MSLTKMLFSSLCLGFLLSAGVSALPPQPNILIILVDDMGFSDLGCYGSEIETPHIDALASNGLRFSQFYNTGRCCPTRAALLTGLYQHQAGLGGMVSSSGRGAYLGRLNDRCVTLAEALRTAGYMTAMSGKWHVGSAREHWPDRRGFDRFYGTPEGGGHHYGMLPGRTLVNNGKAIDVPKDWYSTTAFTDHAVRYIDEATTAEKPLFLYVAYTAPHWPLQAPDETIAKFHDRYRDGWRPIREARLKRQIELGLFAEGTELSPHDLKMPEWSTVDQDEMSLRMATHAAMVHLVDEGVGRIVDRLRHHGEMNNTLILFLSDNGASAESNTTGFTGNRGGDPQARTGTPTSYNSFGISGANTSDTPLRLYKKYAHEGGIATPLIAHWPGGIPTPLWGQWSCELGHVIDFMPTFLEIAGADYPKQRSDIKTIPLEGRSLIPALHGGEIGRSSGLFFEHFGNAAIRLGQWKLVRARGEPWSLYDMSSDPTELRDVLKDQPTIADELKAKWKAWAERVGVKKDIGKPVRTDKAPVAKPVDVSLLPPGVKRVDVFLLMGQSNMKGRGEIPKSQTDSPRILHMNMADDQWYVAKHPLHKAGVPDLIDGSDNAGVGPGLAFAQELVKRDEAIMIALIPVARGGSWIDLWDAKRKLYKQTIRKAKKALADFPSGTARIAGVLWLQGESDSLENRYAAYADKLAALIQNLRTNLNDPELPFIACTIGTFIKPKGKYLHVKGINEELLALPGLNPQTACVDARDLKGHIGDFMHYDTEAQRTIGRRFAAQHHQLNDKD